MGKNDGGHKIHHLSPKRFAEICDYARKEHKTDTDIGRCVEKALDHFKMQDGRGRWTDNAWYWPILSFVAGRYAEDDLWIDEHLKD
jgi:hypothetical protein